MIGNRIVLLLTALFLCPLAEVSLAWEVPKGVTSTQNPKDKPLPPAEAVKRVNLPEGFKVTLFAGEPDVAQPIAFCFDDRGRLWVAECYSYKRWDQQGKKGHDRIVIFEDKDRDGRFDERKVFAENLANLTGIEIGFGGVWICSAPHLYFIPDANHDDKPDGPPVAKLDGWVIGKVGHNIYNGLTWGPDGWLYGCHGIQDESHVGKPGTPDDARVKMRCGIWRYHPTRATFEVVCHGTTNPWGLDFDEYGEGFFTNCVIGHLWHMIPGAHFKRMYGEDYMTHAYELIDQHADHLHWVGKKWGDSRGNKPEHDQAGGGHAHVGAMIYLADNWPAKYRKMIGMCNVHGQRLNFDRLERKGSGYVGRRGHDLFHVDDKWFRGITLKYGPDGSVFISDWCDYGECHDNDGVHTHSGRIYNVTYDPEAARKADPIRFQRSAQPKSESRNWAAKPFDIRAMKNDKLAELAVSQQNVWWSRRARLELQRRAARGDDMAAVRKVFEEVYQKNTEPAVCLAALWGLHVTGGLPDATLLKMCGNKHEAVRRWSVRLIFEDGKADAKVLEELKHWTRLERPVVQLELASSLQRMPLEQRWDIAAGLVADKRLNDDHNLPLMIWYGIEPAVAADKTAALRLAAQCKVSKVRQFIAKRVAAGSE